MKKSDVVAIEPFSVLTVDTWGITLIRLTVQDENGDDLFIYNPTLDLELEGADDENHFVSISTQIAEPCAHCAAIQAIAAASAFGNSFFIGVTTLDGDNEYVEIPSPDERLDIEKLLAEVNGEEDSDLINVLPVNPTFH